MQNETTKTLLVAAVLCIVCSVLVSGAAVSLKPMQVENKKLDIKKNLLLASGLLKNAKASKEDILDAYKMVEAKVVDLSTGEVTNVDPDSFDSKKASKTPGENYMIPTKKDLGKIKRRAKLEKVFFVKENGKTSMIILPVNGKGLWSTLYGFIALAPNTTTIKGLGFYSHGETPGLGGEVDNPNWKAQWPGKEAFDSNFKPVVHLVKGMVDPKSAKAKHQVDGLSGATITANGVSALVQYWLGDNAFGPFLAKVRAGGIR
jgi:Na+-transporting NADH:ubiquinone oxidoreductase subunit C